MSNILYHSLNVSLDMSFMIVRGKCHAFELREELYVSIPCVDKQGRPLTVISLLDDEYGVDPEIGSLIAVEYNGRWVYIPDSQLSPMKRALKDAYEKYLQDLGTPQMLLKVVCDE